MKAVVFHGVGDIRLDDVPEPTIQAPTDAIRTIHSQLAERYAALADAIDGSSFAGSSSAQAPDENAPKGATTAA